MSRTQIFLMILVIALATFLTRALPFLLFSEKKEPPAFVKYLGRVLPPASLGLLVVYCLKDNLLDVRGGADAFLAAAATALLQLAKHNALLSILGGTAVYMVLHAVLN